MNIPEHTHRILCTCINLHYQSYALCMDGHSRKCGPAFLSIDLMIVAWKNLKTFTKGWLLSQ